MKSEETKTTFGNWNDKIANVCYLVGNNVQCGNKQQMVIKYSKYIADKKLSNYLQMDI